MSKVSAPRYLAGLVSTERVVEKPALVPDAIERGCCFKQLGYPMRTWLSS